MCRDTIVSRGVSEPASVLARTHHATFTFHLHMRCDPRFGTGMHKDDLRVRRSFGREQTYILMSQYLTAPAQLHWKRR
jgi:hypothetical protein